MRHQRKKTKPMVVLRPTSTRANLFARALRSNKCMVDWLFKISAREIAVGVGSEPTFYQSAQNMLLCDQKDLFAHALFRAQRSHEQICSSGGRPLSNILVVHLDSATLLYAVLLHLFRFIGTYLLCSEEQF